MIVLRNLTKRYVMDGTVTVVADRVNVTFPTGEAVALLGRNGAGKSSLLRMIAGTLDPSEGEVLSTGTVSWPVGFAGAFHADLTGAQNARFVARVYGSDTDRMLDFVEAFAELGDHFHQPLRSYSSGMRSRLAFGVSMALPFDTYLIDEVTSVGDAAFKAKSAAYLRARLRRSGAIMVSHSMPMIRAICSAGAVLENGRLTYFNDVEDAIAIHNRNMSR